MRAYLSALLLASSALLVWALDALIVCLYQDIAFTAALFTGVTALRLVLRAVASSLLLFLAFMAYKRVKVNSDPYNVWLGEGNEDLFYGSAESSRKEERVLFQALRLARYFKLNAAEQTRLRTLVYCYDCGKVGVPRRILLKRGEFSEAERALWDQHLDIGADIVASIDDLASAADLIRYHEEYFNGGGPLGARGNQIPLCCRIFQVVWMYDCMVYPSDLKQRPLVCDEALLELQYYAGSALDPEVVDAFIKLMSKNKILAKEGSRVFFVR